MMSGFWAELIKSLGGLAILAASLTWLTKSIITHFLSKDVEVYKNRIASEAAREIEQFKAQLQMMAREHEVRFNKLHEKRAEIISELYELLTEAKNRSELLDVVFQMGPIPGLPFDSDAADKTRDQVAEEAADKCARVFTFFNKHKLFFSEELSENMEKLISAISRPSAHYQMRDVRQVLGVEDPPETRRETLEFLRSERPNIEHILKLLEREFRLLLGSDYEYSSSYPLVDSDYKTTPNRIAR
jgi:NTP pyrophosphatase (non-canonical NTP hydrolase)